MNKEELREQYCLEKGNINPSNIIEWYYIEWLEYKLTEQATPRHITDEKALKNAWDAATEYYNDCCCGECDYCLETKDQDAPNFDEWYKLQPPQQSDKFDGESECCKGLNVSGVTIYNLALAVRERKTSHEAEGVLRDFFNSCQIKQSDNSELLDALKWFCRRVDMGEVRSRKTYAKFRGLIEKYDKQNDV